MQSVTRSRRPVKAAVPFIAATRGRLEVEAALRNAGVTVDSAEVTHLPRTTVPVAGSGASAVLRLVDALEDLDDVQAVYANFDIPDEVLADLAR